MTATETMPAPAGGVFTFDINSFFAVPEVPALSAEPTETAALAPTPRHKPSFEIREVVEWHDQIGRRSRKDEINQFRVASYSVSCNVKQIEFDPPRQGRRRFLPIGAMTHFVMTRRWKAQKGGRLVVLRFVGYKARLTDEGRIQLGGPHNAVCGYDARYAPFEGASPGGMIMDARKRTTLRLALDLDAEIERTVTGFAAPSIRLEIPRYYAAFPKGMQPDPEDNPAVRRAVLEACRPSYDGPAPACCVSRGGVVDQVVRDDGRIYVGYDAVGGVDDLPHTAVLRPFVQPGAEIEEGTVIADMVPRAVYGTWGQLRRVVGDAVLAQLTGATIAAMDVMYQGLRLRDVRFCPSQLLDARMVFESPPQVDEETGRAAVQVIREDSHGRNGLVFSEGPIDVDLDAVRPGWERKLG